MTKSYIKHTHTGTVLVIQKYIELLQSAYLCKQQTKSVHQQANECEFTKEDQYKDITKKLKTNN